MRFILLFILVFPSLAFGAYEPPDPTYAPPASYYNNATGTGTTLKANLRTIVTGGSFQQPTYEQLKTILPITDRDPANSNRQLLIYNRASNTTAWDSAATWNREHIWAYSRLGLGSGGP